MVSLLHVLLDSKGGEEFPWRAKAHPAVLNPLWQIYMLFPFANIFRRQSTKAGVDLFAGTRRSVEAARGETRGKRRGLEEQ
jgi:hypothetical protein